MAESQERRQTHVCVLGHKSLDEQESIHAAILPILGGRASRNKVTEPFVPSVVSAKQGHLFSMDEDSR